MDGIVLYLSKCGNTKQYATWLAKELNWELRDFTSFKKKEISNYENIVFGSGVYMGKMTGIQKALRMFKGKSITIFATAGHQGKQKEVERLIDKNFKTVDLVIHSFFYLPGGVDFSKVKGLKKKMLDIYFWMLKHKKNKTTDEEAIYRSYHHPTSYVAFEHLNPMLSVLKTALLNN